MKVRLSNMFLYSFVLIIILSSSILLVGDWENIFRIVSIIITVALFCFMMLNKKSLFIFKRYKFILIWYFIFLIGMLICMIYINRKYNTHYIYMFSQIYHYIYILLFWPIMYYLECDKKNLKRLINCILVITIFILLFKFIIWYLYNYHGIDLVHYMIMEGGENWTRNGKQRFLLPNLLCFVIVYSIIEFLQEKRSFNKIIYFIILGISGLYIIFVFAAKASLVVLLLTAFAIWIYKSRNSKKIILRLTVLLFVSIIVIYAGDLINIYVKSIDSWSILCRQLAMKYYIELIGNYKLFGFSLVTETMELQNGIGGNYYFADLGILSKFFEFGMWGIVFFIPLFRLIYISIKNKYKDQSCKMLTIGLVTYVIVSSILSSDIYLYRNILAFPFVLSIVEYLNFHKTIQLS